MIRTRHDEYSRSNIHASPISSCCCCCCCGLAAEQERERERARRRGRAGGVSTVPPSLARPNQPLASYRPMQGGRGGTRAPPTVRSSVRSLFSPPYIPGTDKYAGMDGAAGRAWPGYFYSFRRTPWWPLAHPASIIDGYSSSSSSNAGGRNH